MRVSTPVPDVGTPVFDANGYINPVWHSFFFTLLNRTGGADGIDANEESQRITSNTVRISGEEALGSAQVPVIVPVLSSPGDQTVFDHGVQYDPALHALVTTTTDGFMSFADKLKLDNLGAYTSGTWTPTLTFLTPGNLAVTYAQQLGSFVRFGNLVTVHFQITTSAFTYTTASGALVISGIPVPNPGAEFFVGTLSFEGLTRAGYTQFSPTLPAASSLIYIVASGSGVGRNTSDTNTTASGTNVSLIGTITYYV